MVRKLGRSLAAVVALMLGGCATPTVLSDRAIDYNETIARAADSQLLLNVVRAAYRNPTHYSAISQLRDLRSTEQSASLSGQFPFGADASRLFSLSPNVTARSSQTPSFDVAPLDTRASALGLFRPVEPQTFVTYWQQGWARSILLSLFIDYVTLNAAARQACHLEPSYGQVDNGAYDLEKFERAQRVFDCLHDVLQVNEKTEVEAALSRVDLPALEVFKALPSLAEKGFRVTDHGGDATRTVSVRKTKNTWDFVLNWRGRNAPVTLTSSAGRPRISESGPPAVGMRLRSVEGMVFYLGELLRLQLDEGQAPTVRFGRDGERTLFRVHLDAAGAPGDRIEVGFLGRTFSIGRHPVAGDATLITLSLLSQLFSQYRENTDLPKTNAVQVVGGGL